ncbi:hypothetical protein [Mesorhizobium sp. Pch-S]|uniref:hypothetical protein n=1 Tax=Mesorhizobium sp. Pch-S TaxID=2082387 RepID=UPI001012D62D|nr:hypothetical protein [Mesorhizobium sp. Pch-S]QAZ45907.1 hypothetical protein C1M53_26340 [Mesorhizobium sp. Pch-S]
MQKIDAWIRNPANNLFKGQSKRTALFELYCEKPETCDLLAKENSCLHCGSVSPCKFGRKSGTEGPTRNSRSYFSTLEGWRKRNEGFLDRLKSLTAYNRVFKTHGHFYLPYSFMTPALFDEGKSPLKSKWVPEEEMTTELLERVCTFVPYALFGGPIHDYQNKEIPKFIADLKTHYPEVFDLLPEDQKARLKSVSYVGRKADITTCAPGRYVFGSAAWEWDGEKLHGRSMLFQPVAGEIAITIVPRAGEAVTITSNEQVAPSTRFLD